MRPTPCSFPPVPLEDAGGGLLCVGTQRGTVGRLDSRDSATVFGTILPVCFANAAFAELLLTGSGMLYGHSASGIIMIIFLFCLLFFLSFFISMFSRKKKENPVSFWYRDIPVLVFCFVFGVHGYCYVLFYSSKERHKISIQREKTAIMSTNIFICYCISVVFTMLLPENKYLNIYINIYKYI